MPNLTCTLCDSQVDKQRVSFMKGRTLWSVDVLVCKNEKCMESRGASRVDFPKVHEFRLVSNDG